MLASNHQDGSAPMLVSDGQDESTPMMVSDSQDDDSSSSPLAVDALYDNQVLPQKDRNPMLSATSNNLVDSGEGDNSLIDDSLFELMSASPRPSNLNRCQSASTLMFTSFSPHLIDRPLTPDFFTDSPHAGSFFFNFNSKTLDTDPLVSFDSSNQEASTSYSSQRVLSLSKGTVPTSPLIPNFTGIPHLGGTLPSMTNVSERLRNSSANVTLSVPPSSVFGTQVSRQKHGGEGTCFSSSSSDV